jgi:EpsI family protein
MSGNQIRFAAVVILLGATAVFLHSRSALEKKPQALPLAVFPAESGGWQSVERPVTSDVREILGPGDFLDRLYTREGAPTSVDFFVAYFASQRTGNTIHSPKHCLPGAGWEFLSSRPVPLAFPGVKSLQVNEAVLGKGPERMLVIYWYQAHGRAVASEYWARFYLVADAIKMNRTDGSLVRFMTPILPGESTVDARDRIFNLASGLVPRLKDFIPE